MGANLDALFRAQAANNIGDGKTVIELSKEWNKETLRENNLAAPGVPLVGDGGANALKPSAPIVTMSIMSAEIVKCAGCQGNVAIEDKFCKHCGNELIRACKKCGTDNQTGNFCANCGGKLNGKAKRKRATAD